jgi:hypothetical protein
MTKHVELYDKLCRILTDYENLENEVLEEDLYDLLVEIQNNWDIIKRSEI